MLLLKHATVKCLVFVTDITGHNWLIAGNQATKAIAIVVRNLLERFGCILCNKLNLGLYSFLKFNLGEIINEIILTKDGSFYLLCFTFGLKSLSRYVSSNISVSSESDSIFCCERSLLPRDLIALIDALFYSL